MKINWRDKRKEGPNRSFKALYLCTTIRSAQNVSYVRAQGGSPPPLILFSDYKRTAFISRTTKKQRRKSLDKVGVSWT
jgi:hypothetical protein